MEYLPGSKVRGKKKGVVEALRRDVELRANRGWYATEGRGGKRRQCRGETGRGVDAEGRGAAVAGSSIYYKKNVI
ncbi:unnamed protein product [Linum trigynum]|uniref:Uncharacterized protein n=1 Tax=Linum trigynum TaxID=586398 RepID=A0AAV2CNY6_9ROSI